MEEHRAPYTWLAKHYVNKYLELREDTKGHCAFVTIAGNLAQEIHSSAELIDSKREDVEEIKEIFNRHVKTFREYLVLLEQSPSYFREAEFSREKGYFEELMDKAYSEEGSVANNPSEYYVKNAKEKLSKLVKSSN